MIMQELVAKELVKERRRDAERDRLARDAAQKAAERGGTRRQRALLWAGASLTRWGSELESRSGLVYGAPYASQAKATP